jgi:hypothetical protein
MTFIWIAAVWTQPTSAADPVYVENPSPGSASNPPGTNDEGRGERG